MGGTRHVGPVGSRGVHRPEEDTPLSGAGLPDPPRLQQQERGPDQSPALRHQGEEAVGEGGHRHILRHRTHCGEPTQGYCFINEIEKSQKIFLLMGTGIDWSIEYGKILHFER